MPRKKSAKNKSIKQAAQSVAIPKDTLKQSDNIYDRFFKGKEKYFLISMIVLVCFIVFKDFMLFKKVYLFTDIGSDSINMYYPWLVRHAEYIKTEGVPGWDFTQGMGQNVFPIWLGDFFSNFLMLFDKSTIVFGIVYMEILKIFLLCFIFFKYLKELKLSSFSALLCAFLFGFCGFVIVGGAGWYIFSAEAVYISIVLYGFERFLNHKKLFWFVFGISCIGFLQPFLLFPYSVFLLPYILVRYFEVYEKFDKSFISFAFKVIGLIAIGVLITSYQMLPDLLQYLESPRVGGESTFFQKLKSQPVFGLADEVLRFTTVFRSFGIDMLGNGMGFKGWQNYLEAPLFYCGILTLLSFPQFFISLKKPQKIAYTIVLVLFCLPVFFPFFRYAFWLFSGDYFRTFSLVIVLYMLLFSAKALSYIEQKGKLNSIVLIVTALFLLFLLFSPKDQFEVAIDKSIRSVVVLLILIYTLLLFILSVNPKARPFVKVLLIIVCFFEIAYFTKNVVTKRNVVSQKMLTDKVGYNDYTIEALEYLKSIDSSFYRINKDYSSGLAIHSSVNDAKAQGFYGTASYYSFNQKNYIKFLGDLGVIDVKNENDTRWARGLGERPILLSLVGTKYWLTKRKDNSLSSMGLDFIKSFGDVKVYRNRFALDFGFTYDQKIGEENFSKLSKTQKDFALIRACVIEKEDELDFNALSNFDLNDTLQPLTFENYLLFTNKLKEDKFLISKFSQNHIVGDISVATPKALFFSMPLDEGWSAKINGEPAKLYRINAGLTGLLINQGSNNVELMFEPRLKSIGLLISVLALASFIAILFWRSKKSQMKV